MLASTACFVELFVQAMAEQAATPTQESASADIHRSASSQSQSRSHSQSGTAAAVLNNSEKHNPGNARVYNDKDDDSFLDEVENTLLGDSSRLSNSNNSDFDSNAAAAAGTRHFKTFSPSRHPPSTALKSQYLHANHQEALDDPATFRRKCRVALFYLLTSTSHELVIYKLAQRTTWPNAILFVPFEFLLLTAIACLASVYMKKTGNLKMQQLIGVNGLPVSSLFTLKDSTPLAVLTVLTAALTVLKDAWLEAAIGTAVSVGVLSLLWRRSPVPPPDVLSFFFTTDLHRTCTPSHPSIDLPLH